MSGGLLPAVLQPCLPLLCPAWDFRPFCAVSVWGLTMPDLRFAGTNSQGVLSGFNKTVLRMLPRSRNLIVVESALMAVAFFAMLLVRRGAVGRGARGGLGVPADWEGIATPRPGEAAWPGSGD